jgi:mannose-6-phosphate isomerase-like protein (cupin superfamily)
MERMEKLVVERPWGSFEQFCRDEVCTVKILRLMPGQAISLQVHKNRSEFWKILSGTPNIVVGDEEKEATEGDEFFIPPETRHRATARDAEVKILEISFGEFDESDEIRLKDRYGRAEE